MPPPVLAAGLSGYEIAAVRPDATTYIWGKLEKIDGNCTGVRPARLLPGRATSQAMMGACMHVLTRLWHRGCL